MQGCIAGLYYRAGIAGLYSRAGIVGLYSRAVFQGCITGLYYRACIAELYSKAGIAGLYYKAVFRQAMAGNVSINLYISGNFSINAGHWQCFINCWVQEAMFLILLDLPLKLIA